MKFIYQMVFSIKRLLKNIPALITKIGVFILLTFILGSVFTDTFQKSAMDKIKVAYIVDQKDKTATSLIWQMILNEQINEYITFIQEDDLAEADKKLADGEYSALLDITTDFADSMKENAKARIEVYMTSYAETDAAIIKSVLNTFATNVDTEFVLADIGYHSQPGNASEVCENLAMEQNSPNAMAYYTIAMLLMMLFYGADYGNNCVAEEFLGALGDRLAIAPLGKFTRLIGRMLGASIVNFLLGCVVVIISHFTFKVNWGNNMVLLLLIIFEYSLVCTVFGACLCTILASEEKTSGMIQIFALGFTIVSGGFYKGDFSGVKYLSVNHYAKTAITNLIYNENNLNLTWTYMGILLIIGTVLSVVCAVGLRKKRVDNL